MVEELLKLQSAFRGFGDEDEDGKNEELPLEESLDEDKSPDDGAPEEEEEF